VDISCVDKRNRKGYIFDPTIHWVDQEERQTFERYGDYLKHRHKLVEVEVVGLLIGASDVTIPAFFEEFRKRFGLPSSIIEEIITLVNDVRRVQSKTFTH